MMLNGVQREDKNNTNIYELTKYCNSVTGKFTVKIEFSSMTQNNSNPALLV